jgi:hypothetical protein
VLRRLGDRHNVSDEAYGREEEEHDKECGQPDRVILPEQRHQASPPENIEDSARYSKKHYHHTHQPRRTHAEEKKTPRFKSRPVIANKTNATLL